MTIDDYFRSFKMRYRLKDESKVILRKLKVLSLSEIEENGGTELEGIITTDAVDHASEVVLQDGLDFTPILDTKQVYVDHRYGLQTLIGKVRYITKNKGTPQGFRSRFRVLSESPMAPLVIQASREGLLGLSIGMDVVEESRPVGAEKAKYPGAVSIIRKAKVYEYSVTPMNCNPDAVIDTVSESKSEKIEEKRRKRLLFI